MKILTPFVTAGLSNNIPTHNEIEAYIKRHSDIVNKYYNAFLPNQIENIRDTKETGIFFMDAYNEDNNISDVDRIDGYICKWISSYQLLEKPIEFNIKISEQLDNSDPTEEVIIVFLENNGLGIGYNIIIDIEEENYDDKTNLSNIDITQNPYKGKKTIILDLGKILEDAHKNHKYLFENNNTLDLPIVDKKNIEQKSSINNEEKKQTSDQEILNTSDNEIIIEISEDDDINTILDKTIKSIIYPNINPQDNAFMDIQEPLISKDKNSSNPELDDIMKEIIDKFEKDFGKFNDLDENKNQNTSETLPELTNEENNNDLHNNDKPNDNDPNKDKISEISIELKLMSIDSDSESDDKN